MIPHTIEVIPRRILQKWLGQIPGHTSTRENADSMIFRGRRGEARWDT